MVHSDPLDDSLANPFASQATYKKLFQLKESTWPALWEVGKAVASALPVSCVVENASGGSVEPLRVVCLGYGEGWRDLPILLALLERGCNCEVIAIEPTWSEQGAKAIRHASDFAARCGIELNVSEPATTEDHVAFTLTGTNGCTCVIRVFEQTVEQWLATPANTASAESTIDYVIAMCVLHLLSDWKTSLGWFLDKALKPGGYLVAGETPGSISAFDGDFRRSPINDVWHNAWRQYYERRRELLLPTAKAVSPKDMSLLRHALSTAGYTRVDPACIAQDGRSKFCIKAEGQCDCLWTAYEQCAASADDLTAVLQSSRDGPDAKTLGALMLFDKKRGNELLAKLAGLNWPVCAAAAFEFRASYRYLAYQKPSLVVSNERKVPFAEATALVADERAVANAIEIKTAIKATLDKRSRDLAKAEPIPENREVTLRALRNEALAKLLFEMREMLCLSRDSFAVATSKVNKSYATAVQLLPLSVVGSVKPKKDRADTLLARHQAYLRAPSDQHINALSDSRLHDLSIELVRLPTGKTDGATQIQVIPLFSAEGIVCHVRALISNTKWICWKDLAEKALTQQVQKPADSATYSNYESSTGFTSFYTVVQPNTSAPPLAAMATDPDLTTAIVTALGGTLLREEVSSVSLAMQNARRLALLHWVPIGSGSSDTTMLQWHVALYTMRRLVVDDAHVGVALLMLLGRHDYDAWMDTTEPPETPLPRLLGAVEPFVNAIAEIEAAAHLESQLKYANLSLFDAIKAEAKSGNWFEEAGAVPHIHEKDSGWDSLIAQIKRIGSQHATAAAQLEEITCATERESVFEAFKEWLYGNNALTFRSVGLLFWLAGQLPSPNALRAVAQASAGDQICPSKSCELFSGTNRLLFCDVIHAFFRNIQSVETKHKECLDGRQFELTIKKECAVIDFPWIECCVNKLKEMAKASATSNCASSLASLSKLEASYCFVIEVEGTKISICQQHKSGCP
jgi:hypothetical protein